VRGGKWFKYILPQKDVSRNFGDISKSIKGIWGSINPVFDSALKCVELVPSGNAPLNYFAPYWALPKCLSTCRLRIAKWIYVAPKRQERLHPKKCPVN